LTSKKPGSRVKWSRRVARIASVAVLAAILIGGATASLTSGATTADQDFAARCAAAGVVRCWGFDSQADFAPDSKGPKVFASNNGTGPIQASLDTTVKVSGASSLKFSLPSNAGTDWGGSWHSNFADDFSVQFGEGETFYVQYRARFDPGLLRQFKTVDGSPRGWKTSILGEGSQANQPETYSCTELEIVWQQDSRPFSQNQPGVKFGFPSQYHSCGNFDTYEWNDGTQIVLQHPRPPLAKVYYPNDPNGTGFYYFPNEWMTFKIRVDIGTWNTPNSRIRWYAAREGQPSVLIQDTADKSPGGIVLHNTPGSGSGTNPGAKYGKVWLIPYHTNKDASESYTPTAMWFDELIVSRNDIADPGSGPRDTLAPASPAQLSVR